MAIGTLAAIGLAAGGIGAVASSSASKNAANKAANATQYAADQSAAVIRENYDKSAQALAPWQRSGLAANDAINALLGLPTSQPETIGGFQGLPMQPNAMSQFIGGGMDDFTVWPSISENPGLYDANVSGRFGLTNFGPTAMGTGNVTTPAPQQTMQQRYNTAFDNFRNSTGYQFRVDQGMDAINSGYAGAGSLKSGAAMKAINDYGQKMASAEFANYLAALGNQQSLGANAASAQAGVSQNLGNSLANIAMQQGDNMANAALAKGNSGFGNALSMIGGGLFRLGA